MTRVFADSKEVNSERAGQFRKWTSIRNSNQMNRASWLFERVKLGRIEP